jgi:2-oxoglutarate ferredoxin oxidoreductase subunit alpha
MVEDVRLAVGDACRVFFHGRTGGVVPTPTEVADVIEDAYRRTSPTNDVPFMAEVWR